MASRKKKAKKKVTAVAKRGPGRPPGRVKITDKLMQDLFGWISEGKTISAFCRERDVSRTQVHIRMQEPGFAEQIACVREQGEEAIIEEMMGIADGGDEGDVQHRKLQLWMREKRLMWMNPAKYAAKKHIEKTTTHKLQLSDQERELRIKQLLAKAKKKGPQIKVEVSKPKNERS